MGPVPVVLQDEFSAPSDDMLQAMNISEREVAESNNKMLRIEPLVDFNSDLFSKRELRIMGNLALEHRRSRADKGAQGD